MTIRLDHTIVPAKDKQEAAALFAELFGLTVKPRPGYFAQVQINESLTFDFADAVEFEDPTAHHYAFHVSDEEFEGIWRRVKAKGMGWGNAPDNSANGRRQRVQHLLAQSDVALEVRYTGLVPDMFVEGNEVVITGSLAADGVFDAIPDGIMAKCGNRLPLACGGAR